MRDGHEPSGARVPLETGGRQPPARLTQRAEFLAVAAGRRFHTDRLTVQALRRDVPSDPTGNAATGKPAAGLRVGLTVTKRVGHATERNRIRRRLRAAVAMAAPAFGDAALDVVLVGRRDALSAPFETLLGDIARALPVVSKPPSHKSPPHKPRADKSEPGATPHHGRGRGPAARMTPASRGTPGPRRP